MNSITQVLIEDLDPLVNNLFLEEFFGGCEGYMSSHVEDVTDKHNNPKKRAHVQFDSMMAAKAAIKEHNFTKFNQMSIRMSLNDQETCKLKALQINTLVFRRLPKDIDVSQLYDACEQFGEVINCIIPQNPDRTQANYAYVQFRTKESAENALQSFQDVLINGQEIIVEEYNRKAKISHQDQFTNLYIKNLPNTIRTQEDLENLFRPFGDIVSSKLEMQNGISKGYGYCNMSTHQAAVDAIQGLHNTEIDGAVIYCSKQLSRTERQQELAREQLQKQRDMSQRNLYIFRIERMSKNEFVQIFERFGEIESVKFNPKSKTKPPNGYVMYTTPQHAFFCMKQSVLLRYNGHVMTIQYYKTPAEKISEQQMLNNTNFHQKKLNLIKSVEEIDTNLSSEMKIFSDDQIKLLLRFPDLLDKFVRGVPPLTIDDDVSDEEEEETPEQITTTKKVNDDEFPSLFLISSKTKSRNSPINNKPRPFPDNPIPPKVFQSPEDSDEEYNDNPNSARDDSSTCEEISDIPLPKPKVKSHETEQFSDSKQKNEYYYRLRKGQSSSSSQSQTDDDDTGAYAQGRVQPFSNKKNKNAFFYQMRKSNGSKSYNPEVKKKRIISDDDDIPVRQTRETPPAQDKSQSRKKFIPKWESSDSD